ncbi:MAG: hypothetical protein C0467_09050 [Planctomycetaceae bacterium]|nr:hypothetical protein [Planctomycetaceae bacterium]
MRDGHIPEAFIEKSEKLPGGTQAKLAALLARGTQFAKLKEEFFGKDDGPRRTNTGAARAIRVSIHALASEARGRTECFRLRAGEYSVAREARDLLDLWLQAPPPEKSVDDRVQDAVDDLRGGRPEVDDVDDDAPATGGDLGVRGGSR